MEDNGKVREIEVNPISNKLRWDTILAFITSSDDDDGFFERITEEKEKRRIKNKKDEDYEDEQILKFKKTGLSNSLEGVKFFVEREMERLMKKEAEEEEIFPLTTYIPKRKRTLPSEEEQEDNKTMVSDYIRTTTTSTTYECLQGSCSTKYQKVEHRVVVPGRQQFKKDPQYYDHQQIKQTNKVKKSRPRQQAPAPEAKIKKVASKLPPVPQSVPDNIKEEIDRVHGTNITWLSVKALTKSDLDKGLNRLFLPSDCYDLLGSIMTEEEKNTYVASDKNDKGSKTNDKGLKTRLIDPNRNTWDIDFKYWRSLSKNVFTGTNWKILVASFALVPGDKVQIWCFREPVGPDMKLCFAMNIVRPSAEAAPALPAPAPEPEMD